MKREACGFTHMDATSGTRRNNNDLSLFNVTFLLYDFCIDVTCPETYIIHVSAVAKKEATRSNNRLFDIGPPCTTEIKLNEDRMQHRVIHPGAGAWHPASLSGSNMTVAIGEEKPLAVWRQCFSEGPS